MEKQKPKHLQVRFTDEKLLQALRQLAQKDNRSLNGEILHVLQEFVERRMGKKL